VYLAYAVLGVTLTSFSVTHSLDAYYYTLFARLFGVYHLNPYVIPAPIQLADPVVNLNLVPLHNPPFPDPYGPGFTLFAGLVGDLEHNAALGFALWTWRLIGVAATLVSAMGVVYALRRRSQLSNVNATSRSAATFLFHPLTLYESAVGAHNDLLMIAPAIWAWSLADSWPLVAGLLLGVAIAVKYFACLLLPFIVIRVWRRDKVSALLFIVLALGVPLLCFRPFAFGSAGAGTLQTVAYNISMSVEWLLSLPLWAAHAPVMYLKLLQLVIVGAFAVVTLIAIVRYAVSFSKSALYRSITALLLAMPALHPWYALWIVPIGAQSGRWATYAWWFAALSLLLYAHEAVLPTPANHTIFILLALVVFITPVVIARRVSAAEKVASA
ncbi:MAG: glycosyltransferase 87 family protein, partial [Candidatus Eremiobacteraeota bacterium]|nr:glycosyltransferase 87 family protein [Candidatus Eremiobacteraeota bacterium]